MKILEFRGTGVQEEQEVLRTGEDFLEGSVSHESVTALSFKAFGRLVVILI